MILKNKSLPSVDDIRFPKWVHDELVSIANAEAVSVQTIIKRLIKERILSDLGKKA